MSIIISIHYLLLFLIFIYIIPLCITMEDKIQFAFLNGLNIIRCSDSQIQMHQFKSSSSRFVRQVSRCPNLDDLYVPHHPGFEWGTFKIVCASKSGPVHEEQFIKATIVTDNDDDDQDVPKLPAPEGQLGYSGQPYELKIEYNYDEKPDISVIKSKDQPAIDKYYNADTGLNLRKIYIQFPNHPVICRITFKGTEDNPCSNGNEYYVEDDDIYRTCYYNPGAGKQPTIQEMEAELDQVEESTEPKSEGGYYMLNLNKPDISSITPSNPNSSDASSNNNPVQPPPKNNPFNPSHNNLYNKPLSSKKPAVAQNPSNTKKKKSSALVKIGMIFGILLLVGLIGGVGFYMFQKHRSNKSSVSSSAMNIENGNMRDSSSIAGNESNQSLPITKGNDKGQSNIDSRKSNTNHRQRAGTNMAFNQDM